MDLPPFVDKVSRKGVTDNSAGPNHECGVRHCRSCERLRMPAMTTVRHAPTAGVRKWPREEIAGGGR